MKIHSYKSSSGKDLIREYIDGLSKPETVDGYSVLESMENGRFDEITTHQWQGKVWEVYFYKHNRVFYYTKDEDNIYLIHACRKQKNRTEKKDKNIIINRAKELGNLLGKKII